MSQTILKLLSKMTIIECMKMCKSLSFNRLELLQFYIDLMSRSYQLTLEDSFDISPDLVLRVYKSPSNSCLIEQQVLVTSKEFIGYFFDSLFEQNKLDICLGSVNFLLEYVKHQQIPPGHHSVAICHLLLSYHLKPLSSFCSAFTSYSYELRGEFKLLLDSYKHVLNNIPNGFNHANWMAKQVASEFCEVIENDFEFHDTTLSESLLTFKELLQNDITAIQAIFVKTIGRLCDNNKIKEQMILFLITKDRQHLSIISILENFLKLDEKKKLVRDIIVTLSKIKNLCDSRDIITFDSRIEIYSSMIQCNGLVLIEEVSFMMDVFEDDSVLSLIKAFELMKASTVIMTKVIIKFAPEKIYKLSSVTKVITSNIMGNEILATRATQVFQLIVDRLVISDEMELFANLPKILRSCLKNEKIFCTVLNFFINFDESKMKDKFKETMELNLTYTVIFLQAFNQFNHALALGQIMMALNIIAKILPASVFEPLKALFSSFYEEFIQEQNNFNIDGIEKKSQEIVLRKMNAIMEYSIFNLLDYFQLDAITIINTRRVQNIDDPEFPFFARFHTTFLKPMWKILLQKSRGQHKQIVMPYDIKFVVVSIANLVAALLNEMKNRNYELLTAQCIFTSLSDLLHFFYTKNTVVDENNRHLLVHRLVITTRQMKDIAGFAEHYIFKINANNDESKGIAAFNSSDIQRQMLTQLANLIRCNRTLNSTYFFTLVQYYRDGIEYEEEMEMLLKSFLDDNGPFSVVIGLVVFKFSKKHRSLEDFTLFASSIHRFIAGQNIGIAMANDIIWEVCAFVLKNLLIFIKTLPKNDGENRLAVLDLVGVLVNEYEINNLKQLQMCVPDSIKNKLSKIERKHLQQFVKFLKVKCLNSSEKIIS